MKVSLSRRIEQNVQLINESMRSYLDATGRSYQRLIEAMQYSAFEGGKRVRPFLTLEFCRMLGGEDEASVPYAAAIEMIHTYSLIHDDLPCMDNDDLRRGKPTNHKRFGEATALLAGDALLTRAFGVAASAAATTAEQNMAAVRLLSEQAGFDGMAGGQMLDLMGEEKMPEENTFLLMNRLKTGCLIKTACMLGCLAAGFGAGTEEYAAAERYGEKLGFAFQIEDDLLDEGTEDEKTTFLSYLSKEEARRKILVLTDEAKKAIASYDNDGVLTTFADYLSDRTI